METFSDLRHGGSVFRYDARILEPFEPRLFDVDWLKAEGLYNGSSSGRGEAHFLNYHGCDLVLRPYRRGGMVGSFNRDLYLRSGLEQSRAMQEFGLLQWMLAEGLQVPRPVAAQVTSHGVFYRAALLTERIPNARPMEEILRDAPLSADVWHRAGRVIRQMHHVGVDHTDLNRRNILIDDDGQVWLIDFDKCKRRAPGGWTQDNLNRLERSLQKWPGLQWKPSDWSALLEGYANSDGASAAP